MSAKPKPPPPLRNQSLDEAAPSKDNEIREVAKRGNFIFDIDNMI